MSDVEKWLKLAASRDDGNWKEIEMADALRAAACRVDELEASINDPVPRSSAPAFCRRCGQDLFVGQESKPCPDAPEPGACEMCGHEPYGVGCCPERLGVAAIRVRRAPEPGAEACRRTLYFNSRCRLPMDHRGECVSEHSPESAPKPDAALQARAILRLNLALWTDKGDEEDVTIKLGELRALADAPEPGAGAPVVECENPNGSTTRAHLYPSAPEAGGGETVKLIDRLYGALRGLPPSKSPVNWTLKEKAAVVRSWRDILQAHDDRLCAEIARLKAKLADVASDSETRQVFAETRALGFLAGRRDGIEEAFAIVRRHREADVPSFGHIEAEIAALLAEAEKR